ncbi:MAG: hypothetical protein IPL96_10530 [Holophagaceae bacterium]|nr:hypothetical protein [Holophagaceae bacterium]
MPWPEPVRRFESPEDKELRAELAELLGYSASASIHGGTHNPSNFFGAKPTPELVALAEKLRTEAQRRRNTSRHRSGWLLAAAGLPIALALSGLGAWGVQQKHKADQAAAAVQQMEEKQRHAKDASDAEIQRGREHSTGQAGQALQLASAPQPAKAATAAEAKNGKGKSKRLDAYPVIPVERGVVPAPSGTTQVKNQR